MRDKTLMTILPAMFLAFTASAQTTAPLLRVLDRFTAADVPALGQTEMEVRAGNWTNAPASTNLPGKGLAQHSMLYIGEGYNKMFVVHGGKVIWTYSTGRGGEFDDVWMLSNGNILYSRLQYVAEITPKKEVVWRYDAPTNTEIHCCQPIGLDKVLFILNGLPPKLIVMNIKTSREVNTICLPRPDNGPSTRSSGGSATPRRAPTSSLPGMGKVVSRQKFQRSLELRDQSPWAAIRLKNGNTLITDEKDKLTREVNAKGETVWELKPDDLPESYRYLNTQTCTRLANGNTIICSRGGNGKGPQLVEVSPDKKVVWVLQDWSNLGPATAVQILDDPGIPENPGESEH